MTGKRIRGFVGDFIFLLLASALATANGLDGSWFWFGVWTAATILLVVGLTIDVTLALVEPKGRR